MVGLTTALLTTATPALADELGDRLEASSQADFSGEQLVTCSTPDGDLSQVLAVVQSGGRLEVRGSEVTVVADDGEVSSSGPNGETGAMRVDSSSQGTLAERYEVVEAGRGEHLGRTVDRIEVRQSGAVRAVYDFDRETGALLQLEVRNSDGTVYCLTRFISFDDDAPSISADTGGGDDVDVLVAPDEVDPDALPAEVAGFTRLDVYRGPEESLIGYYSDGVFTFTLLHSDRPVEVVELAGRPPVEVAGSNYQRAFWPGSVLLAWAAAGGGYALVGDLPIDLQIEVVSALPHPGSQGALQRWWRELFGG